MKVEELRWPFFLATVEAMKQDHTVSTALDTKYVFVTKAFNDFKVLYNRDSKESKEAAEFVEYALKNLANQQTLRDIARSAATFNEYGFSIFEKIYRTEAAPSKYAGYITIDKIAFRPQSSLSRSKPWVFDEDGRTLKGIYQSKMAFANFQNGLTQISNNLSLATRLTSSADEVFIPMNKLMVMSLGGTESNPAGVSPLVGCYRAFREKILIENLETIGASKDLGGIIELKIPSQILNKAAMDPRSPESEMVQGLMADAANAHAGEQAYFILPSDMNAQGGEQYKMSLKGIDGAGKQYSTQELVNSRKKAILDRFGAGFINLGNDGQGSYNLSESKQSIHGHFVQRDIDIIVEAFNKNLIPQLLALNDIRLSDEDMPRLKPGLIQEVDMEGFSKFVQRIGAVGYLPKTPTVINKILDVGGFDEELPEDMDIDELLKILGQDTSRSGDGMTAGSSGNGTGKISSTRDNSISNLEN
uniref:Portal protein n=2 Tax=unclassified Seunavirus TaxID=2494210 RepID=A0AAU8GH93_9CAUD